ncbi:MAG: hypothetical protein WD851_09935 [Pirellulales bacterium]
MLLFAASAVTQEVTAPAAESVTAPAGTSPWVQGPVEQVEGVPMDGGPASSYEAGGQGFMPSLGTHLRARYTTQGYGQEEGNFDLGTMKLFNWDEGTASFIDGQVTMNDESGVGYNVGLGHRVIMPSITPWEQDAAKIYGISLWSDGSTIGKEKFFPQLGLSLEYLGDVWDVRANGYLPLDDSQVGDPIPTGELGFSGNFLLQLTQARQDTALSVGELELARRLGNRDAWGFVGGYALSGDEFDTEGYRVGARGYLLPDLLLQVAVTDDELFHTNTIVSVVWFIGRTRSDYCPTGTLTDRMRETVMRNDYVATAQSIVAGGNALTDATTDEDIRIVHVDSTAPAGGTGTFEAPLDSLNNVNANSDEGDIVLMHGGSVFIEQTADLQIEQRLLGEGGNNDNFINTTQLGQIPLPETAPGALAGAVPIVDNLAVSAVVSRDRNEIGNFTIDGGANGIVAAAGGSGSALIHDLTIENVTGDGISLTSFARLEDDGDTTVSFNVTINEIEFENVGGTDIELNAFTAEDLSSSDVALDEDIAITNVTSTGNNGIGVFLTDTHTEGTKVGAFALDEYEYDGGAGSDQGLLFNNIEGTVAVSDTEITGGSAAGVGIDLQNVTSTNVNFQSTVLVDDYVGTAVRVNGGDAGAITFAGDINNNANRSIIVTGRGGGSVSFTSTNTVNDDGGGILVQNNTGGTINFQGTYDLDTVNNDAVVVETNTGATINFTGLDINTAAGSGDGFRAIGGGTLGVTGTTNRITTATGRGLEIQNMTIAGGGATFQNVTVNGAVNAIVLSNLTGGQVLIGNGINDADGGTLTTTGDAIQITNTANVDLNDIQVTSAVGNALLVNHSNATVFDLTVDNLDVNAATRAIDVNSTGSGNFDLLVTRSTLQSEFDFEASGSGEVDFTFQDSQITTGNNDTGLRVDIDSLVTNPDIVINDNVITTLDANAFLFTAAGSAKIVDFQFDDNALNNNSGTNRTAEITAQGSVLLNATVRENTFTNVLAAENLLVESISAGTTVNLNLDGNLAMGGDLMLHLVETAGAFNVVDRDNADANNNNQVDFFPAIGNFGDIPPFATP